MSNITNTYLVEELTAEFGKGFDVSNLRDMRQFYITFPIQETLSPELSWSCFSSKYLAFLPTEEELRVKLLRERKMLAQKVDDA